MLLLLLAPSSTLLLEVAQHLEVVASNPGNDALLLADQGAVLRAMVAALASAAAQFTARGRAAAHLAAALQAASENADVCRILSEARFLEAAAQLLATLTKQVPACCFCAQGSWRRPQTSVPMDGHAVPPVSCALLQARNAHAPLKLSPKHKVRVACVQHCSAALLFCMHGRSASVLSARCLMPSARLQVKGGGAQGAASAAIHRDIRQATANLCAPTAVACLGSLCNLASQEELAAQVPGTGVLAGTLAVASCMQVGTLLLVALAASLLAPSALPLSHHDMLRGMYLLWGTGRQPCASCS